MSNLTVAVFLCVVYCVAVTGKLDIYTEDDVKYKFYPYSGKIINFKVKASNDVHIALSREPRYYEPMIEIVLSGWGNTKNVIRRLFRDKPDKVWTATPMILSGNEFRGFWVSWADGVIKLGREKEVEPFMSWRDPEPFPVAYVGVHTGFGSTGFWKIEELSPDTKVEYQFSPYEHESAQSFHFKVKADSDLHVALTTGPQESDPMIEVVIGGWSNTNSVIRRRFKTVPEKVSAETPSILSGGQFRGFWVSWYGGVIAVGREGEYTPFMSWIDPEPFTVKYVGLHTGYGDSGTWIIEDPPATPMTTPAPVSTPSEVDECCKCCFVDVPVTPTSALAYTNAAALPENIARRLTAHPASGHRGNDSMIVTSKPKKILN